VLRAKVQAHTRTNMLRDDFLRYYDLLGRMYESSYDQPQHAPRAC
jgi:hypothetical protein